MLRAGLVLDVMVTTHTLHKMLNVWSNHLHHWVTHRSFQHASPHLWNQLPTSLRIPHPNYSSPSQRPSFEHAGLTCCTLLSTSITFHCFTLSLKLNFTENLFLHHSPFLTVGLISWLWLLVFLLIGFYVLVLFLSDFRPTGLMRQATFASSVATCLTHINLFSLIGFIVFPIFTSTVLGSDRRSDCKALKNWQGQIGTTRSSTLHENAATFNSRISGLYMHIVRWYTGRSTWLLWPSSLYKLLRTCRLL